ncbi:kinetochore Spc7 family protein [Spirosoma fluminis]
MLKLNSTRYTSRCHKAALLLIALGLAALCALFTPADAQSVQAMVRNQPFPYKTGVAMDSALYANVKAKLQAADQLRVKARQAIDSLQKEIKATRRAMDDQALVGKHDKAQLEMLAAKMNSLQNDLNIAKSKLQQAEDTIAQIVNALPRRVRKSITTPDQIARATVDYIHTLQNRKWSWSAVSVIGGFLAGVAAILF